MSSQLKSSPTRSNGISVVIPVYLNGDTLLELAERLLKTLEHFQVSVEIIFVDDASPDGSAAVISALRNQFPEIKSVEMKNNGGQQKALRAGLRDARGDVVAVMDADLQDPPEAVADLYRALKSGNNEAIFAYRTEHYQSIHRMISSRMFKWLVNKMVGLPRGTGCFLIMNRIMLADVLSFETNRFYLPGLIAKTNHPIGTVPLQRAKRTSGKSAYDSSMRLNVAISNIRCLLERD